jgi:hypothetical protein
MINHRRYFIRETEAGHSTRPSNSWNLQLNFTHNNIIDKNNQCYYYHVIRMQLWRPGSTQSDFRKDTILGRVSY